MALLTNPTALTPPRVALIDPRTGAISREWYRFFLSLVVATDTNQSETEVIVDVNSLLASYDAVFAAETQALASAPDANSAVASLDEKLDDLAEGFAVQPRAELGTMSALQQAWLPWVTFDNAPEVIPTGVGSLYWDGGTTLGVKMTTNVLGRVNEDAFYYIKASSAITKGQVVMFTGAVGASGVPTGAPATGVTDGSYIMGVAAETIALNGFGLVQFSGTLKGINTSAFSDGDILWYNPAVTGGLTKTKPSAPNLKVQMAAVINAGSGGSGSILIRVNPGSELGGTDSNVQFSALADNNLIQYYGAGGYWRNISTLNVAAGGTGVTTLTANYLLKGNGTSAVSASPVYIDSNGALLLGTTAALGANTRSEFKETSSGTWPLTLNANDRGLLVRNSSSTSGFYAYFEYNGGTNNGSISYSGGTTAFNTTSDARIKDNIADAPEAGDLLDGIKVRSWDFKADGAHWRYGMVAQELLTVVPEAVSVPADEEMMMGVDYSKLVPLLIKEVQSLRARVARLENS